MPLTAASATRVALQWRKAVVAPWLSLLARRWCTHPGSRRQACWVARARPPCWHIAHWCLLLLLQCQLLHLHVWMMSSWRRATLQASSVCARGRCRSIGRTTHDHHWLLLLMLIQLLLMCHWLSLPTAWAHVGIERSSATSRWRQALLLLAAISADAHHWAHTRLRRVWCSIPSQ